MPANQNFERNGILTLVEAAEEFPVREVGIDESRD